MFQSPYLAAAGFSSKGCKTDSFRTLANDFDKRSIISPSYAPIRALPSMEEFANLKKSRP